MKINGEGIYHSKPVAPYSRDNIYFTQSKQGSELYAFYLSDKEQVSLPEQVKISGFSLSKGTKISLLGSKGHLSWKQLGSDLVIAIPHAVLTQTNLKYAAVFKMSLPK